MKEPISINNFLAFTYSPWMFANDLHRVIINQIDPLKLPYDIGVFRSFDQFMDIKDLYRPINRKKNLIADTDIPGIINLQIFEDSDRVKIKRALYLIGPGEEEHPKAIRVKMRGTTLLDFHYENIFIYEVLFYEDFSILPYNGGDFRDLGSCIGLPNDTSFQ